MNIELFGVVQTPLSKLYKVTNYAKLKSFGELQIISRLSDITY